MKRLTAHFKFIFGLLVLLITTGMVVAYVESSRPQQAYASSAWKMQNIGAVGRAGKALLDKDAITIWGSGSDIWAASDEFYYVYNKLPDDGQLEVRVQNQSASNGWAKLGIMVRQTLKQDAPNVFLALTPRHGVRLQWRNTAGGETKGLASATVKEPYWLKLARKDKMVTGWISPDGSRWTKVKSLTTRMSGTIYIGLAVTAHDNNLLSRATFTHVRISKGPKPVPPTPTPIPPTPTPLPVSPAATTATQVYGQAGSFSSNTANVGGISATSLYNPAGIVFDSSGNMYVADTENSRVLYYPMGSTTATRVYGQTGDFSTNTTNKGGISADSLSSPWGLALDSSNNLYIADYGNNRVLYYPAESTTATRVYGQAGSFSSKAVNNGGISADSLNQPYNVALDHNNNLYISDYANSRVLYYPAGSTTATRVYGQGGDFSTNTSNKGGVSADSLSYPGGIKLDTSDNLYVADYSNSRVLYYPTGNNTATRIYGQAGDFSANASNKGGTSADSLSNPWVLALDNSNNLYIADSSNNRVLYYPAESTTATRVYGQGDDFSTNGDNKGGISASSLYSPYGIAVDGSNNLYVGDYSNNRVLMFPHS